MFHPKNLSELQVLFFIFIPSFGQCSLSLTLISFVLNFSKSCKLCPLALTRLIFFVQLDNTRVI
ncbi:hypothetical protein Hanom_Chr10g00941011 [Helianthus anomalus]